MKEVVILNKGKNNKDTTQKNEQIRDVEIRLIDEEGNQVGIVPTAKAMRMAEDAGLDLVKISPNAVPPVCKIMDYGKFKFEQQKKLKEQAKQAKTGQLKEVQLSMVIQKNDVETKAKHARRFLEDGDKVKVVLKMKGREQATPQAAIAKTTEFYEGLKDVAIVDKPAERLGKHVIMILAPSKK